MTDEQAILESWAADYKNDEGEEFYTKSKVEIILFEYAQVVARKNLVNPSVSGNEAALPSDVRDLFIRLKDVVNHEEFIEEIEQVLTRQ